MRRPQVEAHRGDSANAPENTMAAFKRAVALGVPFIELDIHPTRDGELVVIHDWSVDRTTDGKGAVRDLTVAELRQLDAGSWFGPAFAGERIPLLSEVIEWLSASGTFLNVEIKASPPGCDVPRAVADLLRRHGRERAYVVSSFDLRALLAVRVVAPEVTLALIGSGPEILPLARQHGLPWVHGNHGTVDERLIAEAHASGIRVNVWTVDDPATLPAWRAAGVDKVCTNQPARMLAAR